MIKGETVKLITTIEIGRDPFGAPIEEETEIPVDNVIVGTPSTDEAVAELNLYGKRIAFVLGIPKGDTHNWKNVDILIRNERFRSYGFPLTQTEVNVPGLWNTQVKVEKYE